MPIYEYECLDCGKHFEIFQKISEESLKECRVCKGRLNRLISMCSFQLKGTGWYVTDYKSTASSATGNGGQRADKKDGGSEEKSQTKTETKTDNKAEAKTETKADSATSSATGGPT
jgi:putative FmdB family regulatory protein